MRYRERGRGPHCVLRPVLRVSDRDVRLSRSHREISEVRGILARVSRRGAEHTLSPACIQLAWCRSTHSSGSARGSSHAEPAGHTQRGQSLVSRCSCQVSRRGSLHLKDDAGDSADCGDIFRPVCQQHGPRACVRGRLPIRPQKADSPSHEVHCVCSTDHGLCPAGFRASECQRQGFRFGGSLSFGGRRLMFCPDHARASPDPRVSALMISSSTGSTTSTSLME